MKRKKLRIAKKNVYVFTVFSTFDKKNGNTYKRFGECYRIKDGKREYLNDFGYMNDQDKLTFYSYANPYDDVKEYLNGKHGTGIRYISDYPNIVVCEINVTNKELGV